MVDCIGKTPEFVLKTVFGYDEFRLLQKQVIDNVLNGIDTLAVMPTGGGKSLCYQIPALIFDGLTIVVSPLISLMQDQVAALNQAGVDAVFLNSTVDWEQYKESMNSIRFGTTKIVYVSPEGLATPRINELLHDANVHVSCITIDEAHCVSAWGHDFRPDYLEISSVRKQFKDAVCLALTATATQQVRDDIVRSLNMRNPSVLLSSFDRPNIFLSVKQKKKDGIEQIVECIERHKGESGIIYCFSKRDVDFLTEELRSLGYSALNYHAGLSSEVRASNQAKFIDDDVLIMVATLAFGMGINKPNVRFVIHQTMPKSIEQYYQEIGRAGRDGLPSEALLLHSKGDGSKIRFLFDESENLDRPRSEKLLRGMETYVSGQVCRRRELLNYFGEKYEGHNECCCDLCNLGEAPKVDLTIPVQKLMSCIIRTGAKFGANYVIDVLTGSKNKKIIERGHDKLSTFGIGTEFDADGWKNLTEVLVMNELLVKVGEYSVLNMTQKGLGLLRSRSKIELEFRTPVSTVEERRAMARAGKIAFPKPEKKSAGGTFVDFGDDAVSKDLFDALKKWRRKKASEESVPPYIIFNDRHLLSIVSRKPHSLNELLECNGVGETKAQKYGGEILSVVSGF
ncbi:MAG: DNA helicase RecQ [Treponema sp.]|nr:DNA helicase RecQ [Treponema sp.]